MSKEPKLAETAFTKGPWSLYKFGETLSVCIGEEPDGLRPCIVDWPGFDSCDLPFKERLANARLIAAAPDLLAALQLVSRLFDNEGKLVEQHQDQISTTLEKIDAALTAATGGNHDQN